MARSSDWLEPPEWWKKWKPLRWLLAAAVIGIGASIFFGARALRQGPHPETQKYLTILTGVPMMDALVSYTSVETVNAQLTGGGYQAARETNHRPRSPRYPPRDLDTLTVADFKAYGTQGELTLEFFNDRLFEVNYAPKDASAFARNVMLDPRLKRDRLGKAEWTDGTLRIVTNADYAASEVGRNIHTEPFLLVQDLRLVQQRREWDAAYGSIAVISGK